jgi:hypothetical protein
MKRCPKCNRAYQTDTQKFCTHDGGLLFAVDPSLSETVQLNSTKIHDAVAKPTTRDLDQPFDPEATIVSTASDEDTVSQVRARDTSDLGPTPVTQYQGEMPSLEPSGSLDQTIASAAPATVSGSIPAPPPSPSGPVEMPAAVSPGSGSGPIQSSAPLPGSGPIQSSAPLPGSGPIQSSAPSPGSGPIQSSAPLPSQPLAQTAPSQPLAAAPPKKKSKLPLILGILVVLFGLGIGALAAAYFVVVRPMLAKRQITIEQPASSEPSTTGPAAPTSSPSDVSKPADETSAYVPPPGAVQFVNSNEKLSGKLLEHYVDFSFYYPGNWEKDPSAGVAGANNFAKVERRIPPDFTQENFAVGWYSSSGSGETDRPLYPSLTETLSAQLANGFPEYRKVSEGPTRIGIYDGYEFRFEAMSRDTAKGDITIWGRVIFVPPADGGKTGATLLMLATSLAPELHSIDDIGAKGELPMLLESFRFGKK